MKSVEIIPPDREKELPEYVRQIQALEIEKQRNFLRGVLIILFTVLLFLEIKRGIGAWHGNA
mgnify:CR=1 FL=1